MDKENGKNNEGTSGSNKHSSSTELLDAASLFGAYWPRGDANAANLFAAAAAGGAYSLGPHPSMPFSMLPPTSGRGVQPYPPASSAAAYSNAYTNTLSVAASQAASLGIPAASAAWWSMASHLAAQDYLARLQASGINFPGLANPNDPYAALGLSTLAGHHKSSKASSKAPKQNSKEKSSSGRSDPKSSGGSPTANVKGPPSKYSPSSTTTTTTAKMHGSNNDKTKMKISDSYPRVAATETNCVSPKTSSSQQLQTSSIFTSPLSLVGNSEANETTASVGQNLTTATPSLPASILSDPNSILGGVRLPPDTEIIKYTSSIVGPKIPGTTNRGRKKTISLDPPLVSLHSTHSSTGMLIERNTKRQRLDSSGSDHNSTTSNSGANDRVEVIKLPATNGSASSGSLHPFGNSFAEGTSEAPLNLSLKPTATNHGSSSSLSSLSNMSANIGFDRISRRKPGPKPRKVLQTPSTLPPGAPSASLVQLFATADSPRPPSRTESDVPNATSSSTLPAPNHKDTRPRNLGRGVSKPKKNTVASLLAQSRALGIKPMPILDPNASMSQQMSLLKSNILAAQQYIAEVGGDEKTLNKFLQEKFRGTLSDSSTIDASTDSDNLTDSNQTDSEMEVEIVAKKQKQFDERALRVPLDKGWKRETVIRGITKNGGIKGDVTYVAPDSSNKFKQMSDVTQYLEYQKNGELSKDNFTFSCRVILGDYLQVIPPEFSSEGEYVRMSEDEVSKRLDELKTAMRTNLPVEQRIEVARRQQAARAAARLDREQARIAREIEKSERQEAARRDREARTQQMMEERELKRQQTAMLKEQERERRRQHMSLIKALENRRKLEERERKKQQALAEKQANKEKKLEQRRIEMEILAELRKPCEDLELNENSLPDYKRIPGLKLKGKAFSDVLMVFEFLHNFGETLGFDMESLPTLDSLQSALLSHEGSFEAEEELLSVMTHLIVCAIEDPGIPNPARHTTVLGQSLRQADITHANISEILRIYLYANATGEVKALSGVSFERDRDRRIADHHQNNCEMQQTQTGKNAIYYEQLHENATWKMSDMLKDKPFMALAPGDKAAILAFLCNELLQNKAVIRQIEGSLETVTHLRKEKWLIDAKVRKLRMLHNRKMRVEAVEKATHAKCDGDSEIGMDSPALQKDDLLDEEENDMSENESVGTQPEEEEDNKLSCEELGKKLEKVIKTSEAQLQIINNTSHQLRATCFGQDRYWRRYWSLPRAGGIFVEGVETSDPEVLDEQIKNDQHENLGIKCVDDIKRIIHDVDNICDQSSDKEVSLIVGSDKCEESPCKTVNTTDNNANEHRKTPNRLDNGEIIDKREHNLDELRKSVDRIVQSLEKNIELEKEKARREESLFNSNIKESVDPDTKHFSLFEKLGECMERENIKNENIKPEVKEELKNEILNELKSEIKTEIKTEPEDEKPESETKWFSVLHKDGSSCEGVQMTAGNRWDNGVGACTRDNITELKIPVFPPPNSTSTYVGNTCDSPAPLQITPEESAQLEYIKKHGLPKPCERKSIPVDKRYGWWRITDTDLLKQMLDNLHVRGARERELKRTFLFTMQTMYEQQGKLVIEEGQREATELTCNEFEPPETYWSEPDLWNPGVAQRVDIALLEQVEALEDKVANASMQQKGWKVPSRDGYDDIEPQELVLLAKERLSSLEAAIERRYLKPPLGVNTSEQNLAVLAQEGSGQSAPAPPVPTAEEIPKGLAVWREAINRSQTSAQLAMCLYMLEASIAWDKSIMKANCQFCNSGDNEDKLLLCDSCDKGYHTYCFKPKLETIPDGDWYCHECMNKATGEKNCIVCGKKQSLTNTRLVICELCPRAYHTDCIRPQMNKVPRGKWYCTNCISKKPQKKAVKKHKILKDGGDMADIVPLSPAASHSSATTNEDIAVQQSSSFCNQSDVSNSSIQNAGSPSAQASRSKEKFSKKLAKELAPCKAILEDLECHDDAWPFLLPVNTKQFPTYRKIIKSPMDLSTIKKRLLDFTYKSKEEFCTDVRQIFNNCETFNEDDSPVGKAGHCMRQFFEARWNELCLSHS